MKNTYLPLNTGMIYVRGVLCSFSGIRGTVQAPQENLEKVEVDKNNNLIPLYRNLIVS